MKIAITHTQLKRGGGAETYLLNLVQGFCAAGDEVVLVVGRRDKALALPGGCTVKMVGASWVPQKLRPWYLDRKFRSCLKEIGPDGSISLARHSGHDLAINGGTHLGYLRSIGKRRSLGDRMQNAVERRAYATAGVIVPHSRLLERELIELYGIPKERISVHYPPLDRERFHPELREQRIVLRQKYGLPAGKTLILFPSGGHERKGLPLLLEAMTKLPEGSCELVVVGRRTEDPGLPFRVHSLGYVDAIEELYAACDLTAMPSLYEPFGLVYVESALCGTPALFPAQAGAGEVLPEPLGLCLRERTPEALAKMLEALVGVVGERKRSSVDLPLVKTVAEHVAALKAEIVRVRAG